jgi:phage/plasmid-associated DNA primase
LGNSIINCWTLVNRPFKSEYPGNREWNKNAAQLRYTPTGDVENLNYPHWRKILQHCGAELTPTLLNLPWAVTNGITTGEDYLKCWIASLFKDPTEPLPYLFLYGPQDSGKSILHEALSLLMTTGQQRADAALINQTGFNGELEGAVLCIIEETDLRKSKIAYNRIKDWVTGREMLIHPKGLTPYHTANTTHWIQCANDHNACPIFPGDTRITMCWVPPLEITAMIPKRLLLQKLQAEAPDFLAAIMDLDIPASTDRLAIPALATEDKATMQSINATPLERFITDCVENAPGNRIKFSDFFDKFQKSLEPNEIVEWTKRRMGAELPPQYPKGRIREDGQFYIGNVCWRGTKVATQGRYVFVDPYIVLQ